VLLTTSDGILDAATCSGALALAKALAALFEAPVVSAKTGADRAELAGE
jgi:hypothetical protein